MTEQTTERTLTRRSVVKGAAWAAPVLALAVATPARAASMTDIGAFEIEGSCGVLGVLGPGFELTASPDAPIPAGTTIQINGSGIANIGVFTATPAIADVAILSPTSRSITLTADVPAGSTVALRTTLSISVAFTLEASVNLPTGYTATGAKTTGSVSATLALCSAS